jgi:drug/metabolite transporter (DMT)-like permease
VITRLKLICVALFWGGTFVAGRIVGPLLPPPVSAMARFVIATLLMVATAYVLEGGLPRLDRRLFAVTALLGFLGIFAYNNFFFAAVQLLPASRTALLVALNPVATALLNALLFRQPLAPLRWLGILVSFLGASIVITHGDPTALVQGAMGRGEWIMLAGVLCWALYTILSQLILKTGLSPIASTTYASLWGSVLLTLYAIPSLGQVHWSGLGLDAALSVLYLGIPGTAIAYIWYFDGVKELGAPRTAVFNNFVPVFGVLLSALLLHERVPLSTLLGGGIVLCGVALTSRGR